MKTDEGTAKLSEPSLPGERGARRARWFAWRRVAVLLLALLVAWIAWTFLRYQQERQAVADIEAMGGFVQYWSPFPAWVSDYAGEEPLKPFSRVSVTLWDVNGNLAKPDFARLKSAIGAFRNVRALHLAGGAVDDAWLAQLQGLENVRELVIEDTNIGDDGLQYLKGWSRMERLWLGANARLSDRGLAHLTGIPSLNHLQVQGNAITDQGVRDLKTAIPRLRTNRGI